jgi:hypothetical protein
MLHESMCIGPFIIMTGIKKKTVSVVRAVMAECQNDSTLNEELMVKTKAYCIFSKQGSGRVLLWLLMASNH